MMAMTSDQLTQPGKETLADFYHEDELDLRTSYRRHLDLARHIAKPPYLREAWLTLLIAVECLLKDVYCSVRYTAWGNKLPVRLEHKELYNRQQFIEASVVKSFGHDIKFLGQHLASIVVDLKTDRDFGNFTNSLPSDGSWIKYRYQNPKSDAWYKSQYEKLEINLTAILSGKLGRWK